MPSTLIAQTKAWWQHKETRRIARASAVLAVVSLLFAAQKAGVLSALPFGDRALPFYALTLIVLSYILFLCFAQFVVFSERLWNALLAVLPSALIVLIAVNALDTIHYVIHIAVGLYVVALGVFIVWRHHQRNASHSAEQPVRTPRLHIAVLALVLLMQCGFGLHNLSKQALVDEPLWAFERVEKYWKNIAERDWINVRPSDKPGVTTAIVAGAGLLSESSFYYNKTGPNNRAKDLEHLYHALRAPLLLFAVAMLPLFYVFLRRLLNSDTALVATILIGLSPILLGMSRIINPDGFLWIFLSLTVLSYLAFVKTAALRFLYASGLFFGLALLTKYVANIFLIFLLFLIFAELIFLKKNAAIADQLRARLTHYAIFVFTALATFYLLFPGVWLEHSRLFKATLFSQAFELVWPYFFGVIVLLWCDVFRLRAKYSSHIINFMRAHAEKIAHYFSGFMLLSVLSVTLLALLPQTFFDAETIVGSPKSASQFTGAFGLFFSGFYPLIFGSTLFVVLGAIAAYFALLKKKIAIDSHTAFAVLMISAFILSYYLGSVVNSVAPTVRYQIALYPLFAVIGAIGLVSVQAQFTKVRYALGLLLLIVTTAGVLALNTARPHYFSFANVLLPNHKIINPKDMGDGSFAAARFLNTLPEAHRLTVWSDKRGVCAHFVGTCMSSVKHKDIIQQGIQFDYYIVSRGREVRTTNMTLIKKRSKPQYLIRFDKLYLLPEDQSVFALTPGTQSANYVRVFSADGIDLSYDREKDL